MTTLKDMPMISVEQKNRFREAALEVEKERDALAAECEAWSAMAVALANKHPVDSQTFDYMDEIRGTDWGKCLASRDARVKAEALEEMAESTPMKYDGPTWQELKVRAQKYRKQAEEMGDD